MSPPTIRELWLTSRERLSEGEIADAQTEAELLLRLALRENENGPAVPASFLFQRLSEQTDVAFAERLEALLLRRLAREPTAQIAGSREFYGLDFELTRDVLIPRPETELLVDAALAYLARRAELATPHVADVGTGSGAIGVSLAVACPRAVIFATDVSRKALEVARRNARRHEVERRILFRHGNLLESLSTRFDLIVANLPYVTTSDWQQLEPELRDHEPRVALDGGPDGLDVIRSLLRQTPAYLKRGAAICLEFGAGQKDALLAEARNVYAQAALTVLEDLAGIPRVLLLQT